MAYFAIGPCLCCKRQFTFNPDRVPSLRVNGSREPVCQPCMIAVNIKRASLGFPPHPIDPDAYNPEPELSDTDAPYL